MRAERAQLATFNEQVSQEVQLLVDAGPFSGMVGAYYLDATADTLFDVRLFTTLSGLTAFTKAAVDTETYAIFGDFTYDFSDQLSLSVGGRYTWDKRTANILRQNYLGGGSPFFGGLSKMFLSGVTPESAAACATAGAMRRIRRESNGLGMM
mgnify:CR=1 FL=1